MTEIWKSLNGIVDNGEYYEISSHGNIRSIDRIDNNGKKRKGKLIKSWKQRDGYFLIGLSNNGKRKIYLVHRLVGFAFVKNLENKNEINHIDGNKSNNCSDNLEWNTRNENVKHAYKKQLIKKKDIGSNHYLSKLNENKVLKIRSLYKTGKYSQSELGKMFNVRQDTISDVIRRKTWKHVV